MTTPNDMTEQVTDDVVDGIEVAEYAGDDVVAEEVTAEGGEVNPRLIVKRQGVETEEVFGFVAPATIGRFDPSVGPIDIDLGSIEEGGYVSRKHAKITETDGIYSIHDLGSSNGVYLLRDDEFQRVTESELVDGDEIAFGNARFVFRLN